jgi:hypothetical protein
VLILENAVLSDRGGQTVEGGELECQVRIVVEHLRPRRRSSTADVKRRK